MSVVYGAQTVLLVGLGGRLAGSGGYGLLIAAPLAAPLGVAGALAALAAAVARYAGLVVVLGTSSQRVAPALS
jgi:hypothetical protein